MTTSGKRRHHSAAAEEIAGNEDLVIEILLHLPVKSLLRFESVSKKWLSLISDPSFAQNYSRRRNPNFQPSGLLLNYEYADMQLVELNDDVEPVNLSYPEVPGRIRITESCNGLLIYYSPISDIPHICNLTTKQFIPIHFPSPEFECSFVAVNLAFDPFKSPHYKLIRVQSVKEVRENDLLIKNSIQFPSFVGKKNQKKFPSFQTTGEFLDYYRIDIYSSETRSWRNPTSNGIPLIFSAPFDIAFIRAVYFNSAVHWYSDGETSLYFSTDTECLKTMPMPSLRKRFNDRNVRYFAESSGHLHIIVIDKPYAVEFDILELKADYSGWFVKYCVNLDSVMITFPEIIWDLRRIWEAFSVLCVVRAEKEEESILVLCVFGEAISFNIHNKTSKKLSDLVPGTKLFRADCQWYETYQYMEILVHV